MFAALWFRAPARARLHALRELYRRFFGENTPDARGRRLSGTTFVLKGASS